MPLCGVNICIPQCGNSVKQLEGYMIVRRDAKVFKVLEIEE
jgi:ribosomal protein L24E